MNKSYRLIWSPQLGQMVVASELATSRGKCGGTVRSAAKWVLPAFALLAVMGGKAYAQTTPNDVVQGPQAAQNATCMDVGGNVPGGNSPDGICSAQVFIGQSAGANTRGEGGVYIGLGAGSNMTALPARGNAVPGGLQGVTAVGQGAGMGATTNESAFFGAGAGGNSNGSQNTFIGSSTGSASAGSRATALGWAAAWSAQQIDDSVSIGTDANNDGPGPMDHTRGTAVGVRATSGRSAAALGYNARATGDGSVAVGTDSSATGNSTAVGINAAATGPASLALGVGAQGSGERSVATGALSSATGNSSVASGTEAQANGDGAVAVGANSSAGGNATAVGINAAATAGASLALGVDAQANEVNSVALGAGSVTAPVVATTSGTIAGTTYTYAGTAPSSTVSVGSAGLERTITNVGAGRVSGTSTDAINGSQLFATNQAINNVATVAQGASDRAVKYDWTDANGNGVVDPGEVNYTKATLAGPVSTDGGLTGGTTITNVHQGAVNATSTDAVNGAQLFAITGGANPSVDGVGIKYARTSETGLTPADAHATVGGATALGYNATASHAQSVALGRESVANGSTLGAAAYNPGTAPLAGTTPVGEVSIGSAGSERRITNLAAGANDTDAVNVSQLKAVTTSVYNGGIKYFHANSTAPDSIAGGAESIAVGPNAVSNGVSAIAIGNGSSASGLQSIAVGTGNVVTGDHSGAFGDPNVISGSGSYALGNNNTIAQNNTFVVGNSVTTTQANSVVLGNASTDRAATTVTGATIAGTAYTFAGQGSAAKGVASMGAAGNERQVINVAAGDLSATSTDAVNGSQLFATNQAVNSLSTIVTGGGGIKYFHANSTAPDSSATGSNSIAVGPSAVSSNIRSTAMGNAANASGIDAMALGSSAQAAGQSATASGANANASATAATTYGANSSAAGTSSVAVGSFANASVARGTAIGADTVASGLRSTALGTNAQSSGTSALALGDNAQSSATNAVALGTAAQAQANNALAMGVNAVADVANSVALGSGSNTDPVVATASGTIRGTTYNYAGTAPIGTVSVGTAGAERTVTNMAAGRVSGTSTDAINGSQLFATNQAVEQLAITSQGVDDRAVKYDWTDTDGDGVVDPGEVDYTKSTLAGPVSTDGGTTGGTTFTNLHKGAVNATSSDAINGSQLYNTAQSIANNFGGGSTVNNDGTVSNPTYVVQGNTYNNVGDALTAVDGDITNIDNRVDILGQGWTVTAQGANGTNVGADSATGNTVDLNNSDGNIVVTKTTGSNNVTFDLADDITVDNTTINENLTVHGDTYLGDNFSVVNNEVTYDGPITNDYSVVNKKYVDDSITNFYNSGTKYFHANSTDPDSVAVGANSVAVGPNAVSNGDKSVAIGDGAQANDANSVALGAGSTTAPVVATASGTVADTTYTYAGGAPVGTVSVGAPGAERTVTNVAAGRVDATSTDAVNGSQLHATNQEVAKLDSRVDTVETNITNLQGDVTNLDNRMTTVEGDITNIKNGTAGLVQQTGGAPGSGEITVGKDTGGTVVNVAGTEGNRVVTGVAAGTVSATSTDAVNGSQLHATNQSITNLSNTSVKYDTDANGNKTNSITLVGGNSTQPVTISNVANGTKPNDAVNVSQLTSSTNYAIDQSKQYTDQQIHNISTGIQNDMWQLDRGYRGATAAAMAAAALPQPYLPGRSMLSVGMGSYEGEAGMAVGLSGTTENGRWVYKAQASGNTTRDWGFSVGAGIQW